MECQGVKVECKGVLEGCEWEREGVPEVLHMNA